LQLLAFSRTRDKVITIFITYHFKTVTTSSKVTTARCFIKLSTLIQRNKLFAKAVFAALMLLKIARKHK